MIIFFLRFWPATDKFRDTGLRVSTAYQSRDTSVPMVHTFFYSNQTVNVRRLYLARNVVTSFLFYFLHKHKQWMDETSFHCVNRHASLKAMPLASENRHLNMREKIKKYSFWKIGQLRDSNDWSVTKKKSSSRQNWKTKPRGQIR